MAAILADDIFICIFLNENDRIPIQISVKFVPNSPVNNKAALVQVMALSMRQAIIWTNDDPVHWCIYVALRGDEFIAYWLMLTGISIKPPTETVLKLFMKAHKRVLVLILTACVDFAYTIKPLI